MHKYIHTQTFQMSRELRIETPTIYWVICQLTDKPQKITSRCG